MISGSQDTISILVQYLVRYLKTQTYSTLSAGSCRISQTTRLLVQDLIGHIKKQANSTISSASHRISQETSILVQDLTWYLKTQAYNTLSAGYCRISQRQAYWCRISGYIRCKHSSAGSQMISQETSILVHDLIGYLKRQAYSIISAGSHRISQRTRKLVQDPIGYLNVFHLRNHNANARNRWF